MEDKEKEAKIAALFERMGQLQAEQTNLRSKAILAPTFTQRNFMYEQADKLTEEIVKIEKTIHKLQSIPTKEEIEKNSLQKGTIEYLLYLLEGGK